MINTRGGLSRRIGVFICHCGSNIAGTVDVAALSEYASNLPQVAHAETHLFACSEDGVASVVRSIRERSLDRVVVAACTPRTHERLFKDACQQAGINRHLLEFVSVREHCSWIHQTQGDRATEKAKELVRMGVRRAARLTPQEDIEAPVTPSALVIGAGVSGMSAALSLATQGIKVYLVEKESTIGGNLRYVDELLPGYIKTKSMLKDFKRKLRDNPNVHLRFRTRVIGVEGSVGDFRVKTRTLSTRSAEHEMQVGAIIVATGAAELKPLGFYGYRLMKNVVTQVELEEMLRNGGVPDAVKNFVFVNCVGARVDDREYCGRFCCGTSIKNALRIKGMVPGSSVTVLERDVVACGVSMEDYYRQAREAGIRFIRYAEDRPPRVTGRRKARSVQVYNPVSRRRMEIPSDMLILTTPLVPRDDSKTLSQVLKVPLGPEGFFLEAHVKLRPVEFSSDGIYVCGSARFPVNVADSISQGYAAAGKTWALLKKRKVTVEPITGYTRDGECTGCGACVSVCPYEAIALEIDSTGRKVARVNEIVCKGCGCCVATCPAGVMQQKNWGDPQLYPPVSTIEPSTSPAEPKALVFACNWCSYAGADLAGVSRLQIPHNVRVVRVMCSSRVRPEAVVRALSNGMDGVMILGCHPGECHYVNANLHTRRRALVLKKLLELTGIAPERVKLDWVSASEGKRYASVIEDFILSLKRLANAG